MSSEIMPQTATWRRDRITKLLHELRYEVERGLMENDLGPEYLLGYSFITLAPGGRDYVRTRFEMSLLPPDWFSTNSNPTLQNETVKASKPKEPDYGDY